MAVHVSLGRLSGRSPTRSRGSVLLVGSSETGQATRPARASQRVATCDVDVLASRAALLGIEIENLTVEGRGHFIVRR